MDHVFEAARFGGGRLGKASRTGIPPEGAPRSHVDGSIQLKQGGGGKIAKTDVRSDIQLFTNSGLFVVESNHVDGNLQCKSNNPKPTGGNNVAQGNKEDQCRGL